MITLTLPNQFIVREGEAPAEPLRRQLGKSLALPLERWLVDKAHAFLPKFTVTNPWLAFEGFGWRLEASRHPRGRNV